MFQNLHGLRVDPPVSAPQLIDEFLEDMPSQHIGVLSLKELGWSHRQIALFARVTKGTVTRWHRDARKRAAELV